MAPHRAGGPGPICRFLSSNRIDPAPDRAGRAADIPPAAQDPLGAARGIAFGVAIMVPVWGLIGSVAYRLFH